MNSSKRIFYVFVALVVALSGCTNSDKRYAGETLISGNIQFPAAGKIYFYSYADSVDFYLARLTPVDSVTVDNSGSFAFHLKINKPQVFNLQYAGKDLVSSLFIRPGDQLEIRFYGKQNVPKITPFGGEAKFNTFLLQFVDTFYNETTRHNEYYIASNYMDIHQFETYNDKRKQEMMDFYTGFFKEDSLPDIHRNFLVQTICYELASDRLMYLWKKRMKGVPVAPDSSFLNFSNPAFVENFDAFITPSYIRFINLYLRDTYERMVENERLPVHKGDTLVASAEKYKLAQKLFKPPFRDAVLYNLIINDMNDVANRQILARTDIKKLDELRTLFEQKYHLN